MMKISKAKNGQILVTINEITKNVTQWAKDYGINPKTLSERIKKGYDESHLFDMPDRHKTRPKFNENYFDIVDTADKAYWLGFIWSDGYLGYRIRENGREEYNLKISLCKTDYDHLNKFNKCIDGKYEVKFYKQGSTSFCGNDEEEARLFITNKHMGKILRNKYGIIAHRGNCENVIKNVPDNLKSDFIRGVVDADGSFSYYTVMQDKHVCNKYSFQICGSESLLRYIEQVFIDNDLIDDIKRKLYKRHKEENRDLNCLTLRLSGKHNVIDILDFLYKDSHIYLDRKFDKYLMLRKGCELGEV